MAMQDSVEESARSEPILRPGDWLGVSIEAPVCRVYCFPSTAGDSVRRRTYTPVLFRCDAERATNFQVASSPFHCLRCQEVFFAVNTYSVTKAGTQRITVYDSRFHYDRCAPTWE